MNTLTLYRIDPVRRTRRFYIVDVQSDLFGQWSFIYEWGRIGSPGQMRMLPARTRTMPGLGHAQLTTTAIYADAVSAEEKNIACRMWGQPDQMAVLRGFNL